MAYIKIFPIKSTVKKAVAYITNPDKTDEQKLVSSFGCSPETADLEFAMTAEMGKNNVMEKGDNLAWHMIIPIIPMISPIQNLPMRSAPKSQILF